MVRAGAEMKRDASEREAEGEAHALLYNFIQRETAKTNSNETAKLPSWTQSPVPVLYS